MTMRLRFPSEATAIACMGACYGEEGWIEAGDGFYLDVIGAIDGDDGFHINALGTIPAKAEPFLVYPTNPAREFA